MVLVHDTSSECAIQMVCSFIETPLMVIKLWSGHKKALQMIKGKELQKYPKQSYGSCA